MVAVIISRNKAGISTESRFRYAMIPKTIRDITAPDIAISMGCGVKCPFIGRDFDDDWGLEDPTGKPDEEYLKVIGQIQEQLKRRLDIYCQADLHHPASSLTDTLDDKEK